MRFNYFWVSLFFLAGCAGFHRECSSSCAENVGSDWIIVQYKADGTPINCWKLKDESVSNEPNSDGIYWVNDQGHLIHISGWYNRVQVNKSDYEGAAKSVGIILSQCLDGSYKVPPSSS